MNKQRFPNEPAPAAEAVQPEAPNGYEAVTPGYTAYVSPERYAKFSPAVQKWYRPYWGRAAQPTDQQLEELFSAVHQRGEFGPGFCEDARRILAVQPGQAEAVQPVPARPCVCAAMMDNGELPEAAPAGQAAAPVAFVPVHPRTGPLWSETFPAASDVSQSRPRSYPLMALCIQAPAAEAVQPELPRLPEFNVIVDICRFALRHQDASMLEASSHQVERLMDILREKYHRSQYESLAKMWLRAREDIKHGRRASRLVPSGGAEAVQPPAQAVRTDEAPQ